MKRMLRKLQKYFGAGSIVVVMACSDPYQQPINGNSAPKVVDVYGEDDLSFGPSSTNELTGREQSGLQAQVPLDGSGTIFPSDYVFVRFNKILDGDTLETTVKDSLTGRQLGQCGAPPGVYTLSGGGLTAPNVRSCYNPSDMLVTVEWADSTSTVIPFLHYNSTYTLSLSAAAKDKQGRSVGPFSVSYSISDFELLYASSLSKAVNVFISTSVNGAPAPYGAPIKDSKGDPVYSPQYGFFDSVSSVRGVRLVFSGPVVTQQPATSTAPQKDSDSPSLIALQSSASLQKCTDISGTSCTEYTALDASGKTVKAKFSGVTLPATDGTTSPVSTDPRIVFMYSPQYVVVPPGQKPPKLSSFDDGFYQIVIPTNVTDNGTVTGTPVPLAGTSPTIVKFVVCAADSLGNCSFLPISHVRT